jgi:hemolysin III
LTTSLDDRPSLRGLLHRVAFLAYLPLFLLLVGASPHRHAVAAYAIGVLSMLGVSSVYHYEHISPTLHRRLKRVDHSTILLAIAGSTTGVAAFVPDGAPLIISVWIAAGIGVAVRMLWIDAPPPLVAIVYVAVGWMPIVFWSSLTDGLGAGELALVALGGVFYTVGAVIYARKKPNPWPRTFGYHEVFHALVVAGVTAHYLAVLSMVLAA